MIGLSCDDARLAISGGRTTMDRITEALLNEFSEKHGIVQLPEDKRFEHFATYLVVSGEHSETFDTHELVVGDGQKSSKAGSDKGLDAVAIIVNARLVTDLDELEEMSSAAGYLDVTFIFIQAETSSGFDASKIGTFGFGVLDFFSDDPQLKPNTNVAAATEIMKRIYQQAAKFKRGNPVAKLFYVTTGKWNDTEHLVARKKAVCSDLDNTGLFREVEFTPLGADRIQKMYQRAKNAVQAEFTFQNKLTVSPKIPGVTQAYFGFLPWPEFKKIITEDGGKKLTQGLFFDNVRDWQDYNDVNAEIRETLLSLDRARFVLMNNGVTIIASNVVPTANEFYIEDYQIVNGCQTTNVLWDQRDCLDETVSVPVRLISTKDEAVMNAIIKATNRQTEVTEEQLYALQQFPKNLEAYFNARSDPQRLYFERRDRQYAAMGIHKTRIVTFSTAIRAFAGMFLNEPHRTTRNYKAMVKGKMGKEIFGSGQKLEPYYASSLGWYIVEEMFRTQALSAKYKPARYHILLAMRIIAAGYEMPNVGANKIEPYCEGIVAKLKVHPVEPAQKAAAVVEQAAAGNFHRDNIRTEPFTDTMVELATQVAEVK